MATLEERLARMRADLKTIQGRTAGAKTTVQTTSRTSGTGASAPAAGVSGAKSTGSANSLDQRMARMRADLKAVKTASQITAGQDEAEVPGLTLPSLDDFMPAGMRNANRRFTDKTLERYRTGGTPASVQMSFLQPEQDRVNREMETAELDREIARRTFQEKQRAGTLTPEDVTAWQEADKRPERLKAQQEQLAGQMYELRNRQDLARLEGEQNTAALAGRQLPSAAPGAQYGNLMDAEDAVRALREGDHKTLTEKYGLTEGQLQDYENYMYNQSLRGQRGTAAPRPVNGGYRAVLDMLDRTQSQRAGAETALAEAGYDAETLLDWQDRQRRAAQLEQQHDAAAEYASRGPVEAAVASAGTVLAAPLTGLEYLGQLTGNIGHNDPTDPATYRPLDRSRMALTDFVDNVRGTVAENIRGKDPNLLTNAAAFLYETGMSIADSSAQLATMGPVVSLAAMGGSAAAQRTREVLENGGGNRQALVAGAASGVFEALFEKVSIDSLLAEKSVTGWKSWIKETAKQAGVEASEEIFTEVANMMADAVIMGDSSDFNRNVRDYMAQGMSENDAKRQALLDAVGQVAMAGLGGALSGGIMGGAVNAVNGRANSRILSDADRGVLPDADTAAALGQTEAGREILDQARERYERAQRKNETAQTSGAPSPASSVTADAVPPSPEGKAFRGAGIETGEGFTQDRAAELLAAADRGEMPDTATILELTETPEGEALLQQVADRVNRFEERTKAGQNEAATQREAEQAFKGGENLQSPPTAEPAPFAKGALEGRTDGAAREKAAPGVRDLRSQSDGVRLQSLLGDEDVDFLDRLGKAAGVAINIVDADSMANGWYQDGQVYITENAEDPVRQVAKHEITHYLRDMAAEDYGRYEALVRETLQAEGSLDSKMEAYRQLYQEATGQEYTDEQVMEELAADFTERLLIDEDAIRRLAGQDQSLGQRILAAIRRFLDRVRNALTGRQAGQLEQAARMWETALGRAGTNARAGAEAGQTGERRYSFAGLNANRADLGRLSQAEQMERDGRTTEEIYRDTGWFRGMDGKWRWEIDDSGMEYSRAGDMEFRRDHPEYARYQQLMDQMLYGTLTEQEQQELRELDQTWGRERPRLSERVDRGNATLGDIISHDELFRNYPQLRNVRVRFDDLGSGTTGQYTAETGTITLDNSLRSAPEDTLIHEVQHAIQHAEGFAGGSNTGYWSREGTRRLDEADNEESRLRDEYKWRMNNDPHLTDLIRQYDAGQLTQEEYYDARDSYLEDDPEYADLERRIAAAARDSMMYATSSDYDLYRNTAGEIEARDAAARRTMDAETRGLTLPDLGDENTVFAESDRSGWSEASSDPESSSIKDQIEENRDRLNGMDVVARMRVPENLQNKRAAAKWATDQLKATGYRVDRQGYGEITFNKKDLDRGLRYADTAEERAAIAALPYVLKRGIEVGEHGQHKGRNKQTITFAAPVELNGTRGNMAVVVNRRGNHYYAHRIVLPDGTTFRFSEQNNNAAQELSQGVTVYGSLAETTSAAFKDSLAQTGEDVNTDELRGLELPGVEDTDQAAEAESEETDNSQGRKFSLKKPVEETDSEGRELTAEQREFFKDSKVRDEDGNLLVVYHGTDADFTVFDRSKGRSTMDIQGSFFPPWEIDAGGYGQNVQPYYLNITNPAPEGVAYRALNRFKGQNDAGVKAREYLESQGYDGVDNSGEEFIAFHPEQIKRITNQTPTGNPDVRYSLRGATDLERQVEELTKQNQRLEEKNQRLQAQFRRTSGNHVDADAVKSSARKLLRDFSSRADLDETAASLQALYDRMGETGTRTGDSDVRAAARDVAQSIIDSASVTNDEMWQTYRPLRKFLRETKIKVTPDVMGGLDVVGGLGEYRKAFRNRLNLSTKEGRSIDDVYGELSYDYPELFNQDVHSNEEEQLVHLGEVLDALRPTTANPYTGDSGVVDYLAGEILERYYDMPGEAPTFADRAAYRQQAAVERERQAGLERMQRALARQEESARDRIERVKEQNRQANARMRDRMTTTQTKDTIRRHAEGLSRKLLRPTDKQNIPGRLRGTVVALLDSIDLESKYAYETTPEGQFRRVALVDENGKPIERTDLTPTKRTEAARALKEALEELRKDPQFDLTVDPDLADKLTEIAGYGNIRLADMNGAQAKTMWEAVQAVEHSITLSNRMLGDSKYARVSDMAEAMWDAAGNRKERRNLVGVLGAGDKLLTMDMMTPETFFHRMGKPGDELHRQMRRAQDQQITITNEGVEFFQSAMKESGMTARDLQRAERENHTFTTAGGQEITLTTAQLMDLYALSHRKQAMDHIYTGGLRAQGGQRGAVKTTKAAPVHVTLTDVADMLHELTPAQKGFVDRLQGYMSSTLAAHGNEASMAVYGYEKFKEKNYWPIKVNRNETRTDPAQEARAKTIPGFGMTKALTPNANNSVMLRSAVDTYADHLNQMATYAGWLATSENITRLHNYSYFEDGQRTGTVKELFDRVYGDRGNEYLDNLLSDIAQGTKTGAESTFSDSLLNKFKAAKVGANLRVILQQPTAILRAAEIINPTYLAAPCNPLKSFETAKQWAPIALWKDWGYFEMDTGRSLRELMVGTDSALDKVKNATMAGAGLADNVAWGQLWHAVEMETRAKNKDLKTGSDAFYRKCAERFGEIIDRTQVVDSVLHRTQIMRSSNFANRLATSFMSEPSKIYNMAARDLYDIAHAEKGSQERGRALRHVARTGVALIASFAVNAIAQSAPDWWRDDDRDKDFVRTFQDKWLQNFTENFDPVGYIPYLKDIESIIQGFDVSRSDLEGISDLWSALEVLQKAVNKTGKKSTLNAGMELAAKGLDLLGLPAGNLKRDVVGILNTVLWGTGEWETVYELDKLMLDVGNSQNANVFYDTLYRAMDGDWMEYQRIYGDMLDSGFDPEKINSAMNKRMAEEAGLTKAKNLPVEWAPPGEDADFDEMVKNGGSWIDTIDPEALELAQTLDGADLEGDTDSEKNRSAMRMIADQPFSEDVKEMSMEGVMSESAYTKYMAARAAGVSTYDYVDFLEAAREANLARGKSGSSFSQDDVTKALEGSRLTAAQKRAIWNSYGWKKESPWG